MRTVLFYRNFRGFTGGHLKVWEYFNHVRASSGYRPRIWFSRDTIWDESNPWLALKEQTLEACPSVPPNLLFLAGLDWLILDHDRRDRSSIPIINLIQGAGHALPDNPRYPFLQHRAIRICVSEEVGAAILKTGRTNGPVFVIPCGLDLGLLPAPMADADKDVDLVIAALKQPDLGLQVKRQLDRPGRWVELLTTQLLRPDFLSWVNRAKVAVVLPRRVEGFGLPALEGMALGAVVVCPDVIGNRSLCLPGENCFRPEYTLERIVEAAETALRLPPAQRRRMVEQGRLTAGRHDLAQERQAFLEILNQADHLV
jgi:glycosyltransferase involved in cell wall biosynthesis